MDSLGQHMSNYILPKEPPPNISQKYIQNWPKKDVNTRRLTINQNRDRQRTRGNFQAYGYHNFLKKIQVF